MTMFHLKQVVVCIRSGMWCDSFNEPSPEPTPKLNGVYVIRGFHTNCFNELGLHLEEINPEICWDSAHFRPARTTDISALRGLLDVPPGVKQDLQKERGPLHVVNQVIGEINDLIRTRRLTVDQVRMATGMPPTARR